VRPSLVVERGEVQHQRARRAYECHELLESVPHHPAAVFCPLSSLALGRLATDICQIAVPGKIYGLGWRSGHAVFRGGRGVCTSLRYLEWLSLHAD